jgi:PDZ domain-containing protein
VDAHDEESLGTSDEETRFTWRKRHTVLAVVLVIAVLALVASFVSIPYYAITPGSAQAVGPLIGVPRGRAHDHSGQVLLVDVELTPLRAIEWPYFALDSNAQIVGSTALLGTGVSAAQYEVEGELDMSNAQQAATVVALRRLGYKIAVSETGSIVYSLFPSSPASRALQVGEIITGVDGKPISNLVALGNDLGHLRPGRSVTFQLLSWPKRREESATLRTSAWRLEGKGAQASLLCPRYGTDTKYPLYDVATGKTGTSATTCIGVSLEQSYHVSQLPFAVNLNNEGIIGPSAGLAFTLGLIQRLDPFNLTGGHKIAATGTMDIEGQVGDVGGVAQKTVAVRDSGAKVFFVPPQEYKVALAHAGGSLKVYAVSSVTQAIDILVKDYGGKVPGR